MSTSGEGTAAALLIWVMLALALRLGLRLAPVRLGPGTRRRDLVPAVAVVLWLVVAVPSLLQWPFPHLLTALQRDPVAVRDGQVWRVLTSVVVQDGGLAGTVFNLVVLALVAVVAGRVWGAARSVALFAAGVVGFNLITVFGFPSVGAGNSAACFVLVCSLAGLALLHRNSREQMLLALLIVLTGGALLALLDAHGFAVLLGVVLGGAAARWWPPRGHWDHGS